MTTTPDLTATLERIDAARQNIRPDNTVDVNDQAVETIDAELAAVVAPVAAFVNELDDGTGASNSTSSFGQALATTLDERHRLSALTGYLTQLSTDELETAQEYTKMLLAVRTQPAE